MVRWDLQAARERRGWREVETRRSGGDGRRCRGSVGEEVT